jgi:hypothetical protein
MSSAVARGALACGKLLLAPAMFLKHPMRAREGVGVGPTTRGEAMGSGDGHYLWAKPRATGASCGHFRIVPLRCGRVASATGRRERVGQTGAMELQRLSDARIVAELNPMFAEIFQ